MKEMYPNSDGKRYLKSMSILLRRLKTPASIFGKEIDEELRSKMSSKKQDMLSLCVDVNEANYDENGKLIHPEYGDEDDVDLDELFYE